MMRFATLTATVLVLISATVSVAGQITDWSCEDDNDGVLICGYTDLEDLGVIGEVNNYTLEVTGDHKKFQAGHLNGFFTVPDDPTVMMANEIDNDTPYAWTGYQVNISMNRTFTILDPYVSTPDWTVTLPVQQPTGPDTEGMYTGTVNLIGSTPLAPGGTINFGYKINFAGSVNFNQEMIPIPEPSAIAMLVVSALAAMVWFRRR